MQRRIAITAALAAAAMLAAAPRPSAAAQATANLSVTARVLGACTIAPATVAFGDYDTTAAAPLDAPVANITVRCTTGTQYALDLGLGANPAGTTRQMTGGATGLPGLLAYEFYADNNHTTPWANGVTRTANVTTAVTNDYVIPVYGRIPAGQVVSAGNYADTVTMTVNF